MLSGPVSREDQSYFSHATPDVLSHTTIPRALGALGVAPVDVVDLAAESNWIQRASAADLVFINLHGQPGEDGTIQAVLDAHRIPYVGAGVEASVVGLNKHLAKLAVAAIGVPTPGWSVARRRGTTFTHERPQPCIYKPLRGGSSIGTFTTDQPAGASEDDEWLLEDFHQGVDVTVTVLEIEHRARALPAIVLEHEGPYYTEDVKFGAQWTNGVRASRPRHLRDDLNAATEAALLCHEVIGARHISRTDFVVPASGGAPLFLEINTIPGLSRVSNAAECAYAEGLEYEDLVGLIVDAALPLR
jgi:D-alanine-D-alanine ligase